MSRTSKKMTKKQHAFWQNYLNACLVAYNMPNWTITLSQEFMKSDDDDWAEIFRHKGQKRADIFFGKRFMSESPEDQRDTVAHEVCHAILAELVEAAAASSAGMDEKAFAVHEQHFSDVEERTVDHLASVLRNLLVLPNGPKTRTRKQSNQST